MKTINILGYQVFSNLLKVDLTNDEKIIINTINPHSYYVAERDPYFKTSLLDSTILLPDGVGIVLAAQFLWGQKIKCIPGPDVHKYLLEIAGKNRLKVFYLGTNQNTLNKIIKRLANEYPIIRVASFSPPYKPIFSAMDNQLMIDEINRFSPEILFVGMTAPKQEKWVYKNKHKLNAIVICSIGAVFDWYAGTTKRSGKYWIKFGLEWLRRFYREPRRLWRRTFISNPLFIKDVIFLKLGFVRK